MGEISYVKGLEGIIAAESSLCSIDGHKGRLYYLGYSISDLVKQCSFEEVTYLLLKGSLPNRAELDAFRQDFRSQRDLPAATHAMVRDFPAQRHPMEFLQSVVNYLRPHSADLDPAVDDCSNMIYLVAQLATAVAALHRHRQGLDYIAPRGDLSHGANFLYMLSGTEPSDIEGEIMDKCLILHAEHSMNASTFAARVVASTLSSCNSCVSAAVGALYGSLHGGANERVLSMIEEIGDASEVEEWLDRSLAAKRRIMGMGHRVYRAKDPRAIVLQNYLRQLSEIKGDTSNYRILEAIENAMAERMEAKGREIYPNVDFFSGALYRLLGISSVLYTPIFAIARVSGWLAHITEQQADNRLFRPRAHYIGSPARAVPDTNDR